MAVGWISQAMAFVWLASHEERFGSFLKAISLLICIVRESFLHIPDTIVKDLSVVFFLLSVYAFVIAIDS